MNKIHKSTREVYTVAGRDFCSIEEAETYSSEVLVNDLLKHCHYSEHIENEIEESDSLIHILNLLINNGVTSKAKLVKLRDKVIEAQ